MEAVVENKLGALHCTLLLSVLHSLIPNQSLFININFNFVATKIFFLKAGMEKREKGDTH